MHFLLAQLLAFLELLIDCITLFLFTSHIPIGTFTSFVVLTVLLTLMLILASCVGGVTVIDFGVVVEIGGNVVVIGLGFLVVVLVIGLGVVVVVLQQSQ